MLGTIIRINVILLVLFLFNLSPNTRIDESISCDVVTTQYTPVQCPLPLPQMWSPLPINFVHRVELAPWPVNMFSLTLQIVRLIATAPLCHMTIEDRHVKFKLEHMAGEHDMVTRAFYPVT